MLLHMLHPALVHFPIAFLMGASVCGLASLHWRALPPLLILTWWLMAAGWVSLVAAIISGIIAQGGLPPQAPYRSVLNWHTTSGLILALLYGDLLYRSWIHSLGERKKAPADRVEFIHHPRQKWLLTTELVLGIALVILSGWLGGELVYTWGVNVKLGE